jgi:O-antigen ligase
MPLNLVFIGRDYKIWIRLACLISFGFSFFLILLTGSRGGLLALVAVSGMLLLSRSRVIKLSHKTLFILIAVVFMSFAPINWERYSTIMDVDEDYNLTAEAGRIGIWKIGLRAMWENPLLGVGVGNINMAIGIDRERRGLESQKWQTAHNMVVQIGAETGVAGLSLFLIISFNVFRFLFKLPKYSNSKVMVRISEMGRVGFLGLFVSGMFLSQAYSLYWAFYVVFSAVVNRQITSNPGKAT